MLVYLVDGLYHYERLPQSSKLYAESLALLPFSLRSFRYASNAEPRTRLNAYLRGGSRCSDPRAPNPRTMLGVTGKEGEDVNPIKRYWW